MKIYAKVFALCLVAAACIQPTYAHTDDYLDTVPGAHGGQLRMGGAYHFELVVSPTATADKASVVKVYLTDHAGVVAKNSGMKAQLLLKTKWQTSFGEINCGWRECVARQCSVYCKP